MQSRQIWRHIYKCTIGANEWLRRVPHEFEIRLNSDYLLACKFLRTLHLPSDTDSFIVGNNEIQLYVPDATTKESCARCQQGIHHEHLVKFNGRRQKLVEVKNWPEVPDRMQLINANRIYLVITSRDQILLFDIENDCVAHNFTTELLPRQFHLFFINSKCQFNIN